MTRYYNPKLVYTDLVANLYKEQRPDLIPPAILLVNRCYPMDCPPLTQKEVDHYYREDKLIWSTLSGTSKV